MASRNAAALVAFFCLVCYCNPTQAQTQIVVRFEGTADAGVRASLAAGSAKNAAAARLLRDVQAVQPLALGPGAEPAYVLTLETGAAADSALARWQAQPGVRFAQPNHVYHVERLRADAPGDSAFFLQTTGTLDAWRLTAGRAGVRVGVVDTGLWFRHPAFEGQVAVNAGEDLNGNGRLDASDFNGLDDDGNGYVDDVAGFDFVDRAVVLGPGDYRARDGDASDDPTPGAGRGHGTAVTGALAARYTGAGGTSGVAPGARVVPLRAFGADGAGEDDDIAAAIVYAADARLDVLNLSFGDVYYSPLMQDAIAYAHARGVVVVASAGNDGKNAPHYPSDYPDVISVAWLTADGQQRAGRGARGPGLDLGAPGTAVYTTLFRPESDGSPSEIYGRENGSSIAAPQVAGAAALLRSLDATLSPAAIREILTATARDIEAPGRDDDTGAGLVQVDRALAAALPGRVELVAPAMDGGVAGPVVPIVATVLDPAFDHFGVDWAPGWEAPYRWTPLAADQTARVLADTVARWRVDDLADGAYTLRLRMTRTDGVTVERRARVTLDRTPPVFTRADVRPTLVGDAWAVFADVETDDVTALEMVVEGPPVRSDRVARRHGLAWRDAGGGGLRQVRIVAENRSGLVSTQLFTVRVPAWTADAALFDARDTPIPAGYLLPEPTDYDGNGRPEIVLNQSPDGALGDTLAFWEMTPGGWTRRAAALVQAIPRSAGDTDGDGRGELLAQVGGATIVLEAAAPGLFPLRLLFADTTGLDQTARNPLFGALLADLDGDGRGEVVGHNGRLVRILERRGSAFAEVARLPNPTPPDSAFSEPDFRTADFDGDGRPELIAPDADGDVVAYKSTGDDQYALAWKIETDDESLRATVAAGDVDGDGRPELVLFGQNPTGLTDARERAPALSRFYLWRWNGGRPAPLDTVAVAGTGYSFSGAALADVLDGDGRAELVLSFAPDLYVFSWTAEGWRLRYHTGDSGAPQPDVVRSPTVVTGDFDGDGGAEFYVSTAGGRVRGFYPQAPGAPPAPEWTAAFARDDSTVVLRWRALADSVEVAVRADGGVWTVVGATGADSLVRRTRAPATYALRAWRGGQASPFGPARRVAPRAPGSVVAFRQTGPRQVEVEASRPLATPPPGAARRNGNTALSAILLDARTARFQFARPIERGDTLVVAGLRDTSGTPVETFTARAPGFSPDAGVFVLRRAETLGADAVRLTFSAPLDPATVGAGAFTLAPGGAVEAAAVEGDSAVVLRVTGINLGATGLGVTVRVAGVRAADGRTLAPDAGAIRLGGPAATLADAFVYPNPARGARDHVTFGGVPARVTALIVTADGVRIRELATEASGGGLRWDLRDESGARVPSGVYLVRLTSPGSAAVVLKAAVIQ